MKWKQICVLIISLMTIRVIGCWPFAPPPPPPPPIPMHLYEDHYVKIMHGPYERGMAQLASQPSGRAVHEHMNEHIFYPPMSPIPPMAYAEPQERMFEESQDFDLGNTHEFVGYAPREPVVKVRHMNYRYRKRMKSQRPFHQQNAFTHKKEVKYEGFVPQPRRYNVIESRRQYNDKEINKIASNGNDCSSCPVNPMNAVNDKLPQNSKNKVLEEESNRQNLSSNTTETIGIRSDKSSKEVPEVRSQSQTNVNPSPIEPNLGVPVEITSYAVKSPNGAVTTVTEMLYDVENNPFKAPVVSPFLPQSTPSLTLVTESPRVTQNPYLSSAYSEIETGPSLPINTAVTAKFNGMTMSPVVSWTSQRSTDPAPNTWTAIPSLPGSTPPRLIPTSLPSDYNKRRSRKRFSTLRPLSTTTSAGARESQAGLSGAAIAGIIIGSMVSIMLLAGTSLFVMYRNPFRRGVVSQRNSSITVPNVVRPIDPNTIPRAHRWQTRRQRRL